MRKKSVKLALNLSGLTNSVAQIVKLSPANLAHSHNFYLLYGRSVERENSFNAAAVRNSAYGEGFGDTAVLLGDNGAFVSLNTSFVSFGDSYMYPYGVANLKLGCVLLDTVLCNKLKCVPLLFLRFSDDHTLKVSPEDR